MKERTIISMCNNWLYTDNFDEVYLKKDIDEVQFEKIDLPHTTKPVPYNYFDDKIYQFVSSYRKHFKVDNEYKGKRIYFDFEGVMTVAKIYCNHVFLGEHKGGYTPFSIDITDVILFGEDNTLVVIVDSNERPDVPPFGYVVDYLCFGGIYREVSLRIVPEVFIEHIFAKPMHVLADKKSVDIEVFVNNSIGVQRDILVEAYLYYNSSVINKLEKSVLLTGFYTQNICIILDDLKDILLWSPDSPNLYDLIVKIDNDEYSDRIGFRDIKISSDGMYLNNKEFKLRGLNRHQQYPYVGYAMPKRAQQKDADILKFELGVNSVRTSHYPQSKHFLNRCDEIGLLVLEEIPGWQFIGDDSWKDVSYENLHDMIVRDRNHVSIFLWGVRINESPDCHDFYIKTNAIAHSLDATRPTGGIRCCEKSEFLEDVFTNNDFTHNGKEEALLPQKIHTGLDYHVPYFITEHNGHMFPTKRFDNEARLVEHALRHLRVMNASNGDIHNSGMFGWCAFDYNTHKDFGSGDKICYHGTMDMFRIAKFATHAYASQANPQDILVLEPATYWTLGERDEGGVTPITIFTNCDKVQLIVNKIDMGFYYPDNENFPYLNHPPINIHSFKMEWGRDWVDAEFIGYIKEISVITKKYCKNPLPTRIDIRSDDLELSCSEWDTTRIVCKVVDENHNILPYFMYPLEIVVTGEAELIGPKNISFIGGCIGFWIKTIGKTGDIKISVKTEYLTSDIITIKVL